MRTLGFVSNEPPTVPTFNGMLISPKVRRIRLCAKLLELCSGHSVRHRRVQLLLWRQRTRRQCYGIHTVHNAFVVGGGPIRVGESQVVSQYYAVANLLAAMPLPSRFLIGIRTRARAIARSVRFDKMRKNTLPWVSVSTKEATPSHMVLTRLAPMASRVSTSRCITTI